LTFLSIAFLVLLFVAHVIWYFERNIEAGEIDYLEMNINMGYGMLFGGHFLL
jgi:hypothetical protein